MSKLYVIPTPIGNLEDITLRAITVLKSVDGILAEDTRTTGFLLHHFGIEKKMQSFHKFNEHNALKTVLDRLRTGETLALVSDAGTPSISDPGFLIVRACVEAGIPVECLPGPTAFVPSLVHSGFPSDRFCFEGFLPQKKGKQKKLQELSEETRTMIFYESPYRILKTLEDMSVVFGSERRACICRELTKIYEETLHGTLSELNKTLSNRENIKGEIVLVVEGLDRKRGEK